MSRNFIFLIIIVAIGAFFRLYQLDTIPPGVWPDEAFNGSTALSALHDRDFKVFYLYEGLYMNIQALLLAFLPTEAWSLRLASAVFGILTLISFYFLSEELLSGQTRGEKLNSRDRRVIALFACLFLATSFWHISFSRTAFRAIMSPFFLMWAIFFFFKSVKQENKSKRFWNAIWAGLFYGAGFHSYIAFRITPLIFMLFIPFYFKKREFWISTFVFVTSTFLVASPLGYYFLKNPDAFFTRINQESIFNSADWFSILMRNIQKAFLMFHVSGDNNWRHNYGGSPQLYWPIGILFLWGILGLTWSVIQMNLRSRKGNVRDAPVGLPLTILLGWIVLGLIPALASTSMPHAVRSLIITPPVYLFAGVGAESAYRRLTNMMPSKKKLLSYMVIPVCIFLLSSHTYQFYFIQWARHEKTPIAFMKTFTDLAYRLRSLPPERRKSVVLDQRAWLSIHPVKFLTDTATQRGRQKHNLAYIDSSDDKAVQLAMERGDYVVRCSKYAWHVLSD